MAKRETSKERAEREHERRIILQVVEWIAELIRWQVNGNFDLEDYENWPWPVKDWPARETQMMMRWHPKSKQQVYLFLGQTFLEFDTNIPRFLRLVADRLEEKWPPYSPGHDWYDDKITAAYSEACSRMPRPRLLTSRGGSVSELMIKRPSFSEFLEIFREQNPKSKLLRPPSDRSLRRALQRLGYETRPDKRGRPKKK